MTDPLLFLVVDDCPGRYDEFFRLLDRAKHRWVQTHDPDLVQDLVERADVLILDHDMPGPDGRERARWLAQRAWGSIPAAPIIIASTTGLEGVREEMVATLQAAGFAVFLCPADHGGCEVEWFNWALGAVAAQNATRKV